MSRTYERVGIPLDTRPQFKTVEKRKCDSCGKAIDPDAVEDDYAHELTIALDQDQCVNFYRRRDFCPACLEPVWEAVNLLLGITKEHQWDERDREYDE
jgi:hypothetical protein